MPSRFSSSIAVLPFRIWYTVAVACAVVLFFIVGCGHKDESGSSVSVSSAPAAASGSGAPGAPMPGSEDAAKNAAPGKDAPVAAQPRKIIYSATLALVTDDFNRAAAQVVREAKARNGYVAENSITGEPNTPRQGTWKIRIPLPEFDNFLSALGKMGEIKNTAITSQDVSEEFYDVRARLQNKRVEEARLIDLLKKSSGKLSDILLLEKEISRVREEIERMEGRLRFLANQTDLATVTVTVSEAQAFKKPEAPPTFGSEIVRTFSSSIGALLDFGRSVVLFVVAVLPWVILPGGVLYYVLGRRKKEKASNEKKANHDKPKFDI